MYFLYFVYRIPIEPNSIESILCEAIKLEFEAYTTIAPTHTSSSRELNDAERAKLNELIVANKALLQPVDDDVTYVAENGKFMVSLFLRKNYSNDYFTEFS